MKKKDLIINGERIEWKDEISDYYNIYEIATPILSKIKKNLEPQRSDSVMKEMNVSIGVYDHNRINAFAYYDSDNQINYIGLSIALVQRFHEASISFVEQDLFHKVFRIGEENKNKFIKIIYTYMIYFTVMHELGHIAHGHVRAENSDGFISEVTGEYDESKKKSNLITQMKEFDADCFATLMLFNMYSADIRSNDRAKDRPDDHSKYDIVFISLYLVFRMFADANRDRRDFSLYLNKDIEAYDHPHPGIRMWYTFIYSGAIILENGIDIECINSGIHAIMAYDRQVLLKEKYTDCFYSVGQTAKGAEHVILLSNGWRDLVDYYNVYSYIPIEKMEYLEDIPYLI